MLRMKRLIAVLSLTAALVFGAVGTSGLDWDDNAIYTGNVAPAGQH